MSRIGWEGPLIRQTLFLLFLVSISGCAGSLPPAYVNTAQFIDDRPSPKQTSALQLEVKAFENQLQDRTKVGTKRVGVNEINGPLLATQDVSSVTQKSVMTQLRLKGITIGPSPLQMAGVVHDFFVDVDVDPASGRGKFRSTVRADLTVMYTGSQQQIWHKTYNGRATSSGSSVLDSTYEKALRIAFTNLMNQIRQDDSILELQHTYHYAPPQDISKSRPLVMPPPSPPATPPETTPRDTTPPQ